MASASQAANETIRLTEQDSLSHLSAQGNPRLKSFLSGGKKVPIDQGQMAGGVAQSGASTSVGSSPQLG